MNWEWFGVAAVAAGAIWVWNWIQSFFNDRKLTRLLERMALEEERVAIERGNTLAREREVRRREEDRNQDYARKRRRQVRAMEAAREKLERLSNKKLEDFTDEELQATLDHLGLVVDDDFAR